MERNEIRKLINLAKILAVLMLILIIVELKGCAQEAKAGTITGETQLGGVSLFRQKIIDKGEELPEMEDMRLLANVIYFENWHTDAEKLAAYYTGAVVLNRVANRNFPNTIRGVVYQDGQYITTKRFFSEELPEECYTLAMYLLKYGAPDVPRNVIYQSTHPEFGSGVWREINGEYFNFE